MRRAPPPTQFVSFPVTAGIAIMAIAVTILSKSGRSIDAMTMNVLAFEGQPWRILTSALPHADILHISFDVIWLWIFGTAIEQVWGSARTFAIFVLLQVGSALAQYALARGGIGLSGIGYGLFGLLAVLASRDRRFAGAMDTFTIWLFLGWFALCVVLTVTDVMPVGNVAHATGAILGALLGLAIAGRSWLARAAAGAGIAALTAAAALGATVARPIVNLSRDGGLDSAQLGYQLLGHHDADAIHHLRRAVEIDPQDAASWFNLGLGLRHLGDHAGAIDAYRHALQLRPDDADTRTSLALTEALAGQDAVTRGDVAGAVRLYREALRVDATNAAIWQNLALAEDQLHDPAAALDAARHAFRLAPDAPHRALLVKAAVESARRASRDGDDAGAIARYREALAAGGDDAELDRALAAVYAHAGRDADAEAARRKADALLAPPPPVFATPP